MNYVSRMPCAQLVPKRLTLSTGANLWTIECHVWPHGAVIPTAVWQNISLWNITCLFGSYSFWKLIITYPECCIVTFPTNIEPLGFGSTYPTGTNSLIILLIFTTNIISACSLILFQVCRKHSVCTERKEDVPVVDWEVSHQNQIAATTNCDRQLAKWSLKWTSYVMPQFKRGKKRYFSPLTTKGICSWNEVPWGTLKERVPPLSMSIISAVDWLEESYVYMTWDHWCNLKELTAAYRTLSLPSNHSDRWAVIVTRETARCSDRAAVSLRSVWRESRLLTVCFSVSTVSTERGQTSPSDTVLLHHHSLVISFWKESILIWDFSQRPTRWSLSQYFLIPVVRGSTPKACWYLLKAIIFNKSLIYGSVTS